MPRTEVLLARARDIDEDRARELERELGSERGVAVLLAAAFPPFRPVLSWQVAALDEIAKRGLARAPAQERSRVAALRASGRPVGQRASGCRAPTSGMGREGAHRAARAVAARARAERHRRHRARAQRPRRCGVRGRAWPRRLAHVARAFRRGQSRATVSASSLVTLGMGKLGGRELNAGSDVDVIFVYDTDDGRGRASASTTTGHAWRAAPLPPSRRPQRTASSGASICDCGPRDPRVRSSTRADAAERYYETWGRLWERAALLRARPIAGDLALGRQLEREIIAALRLSARGRPVASPTALGGARAALASRAVRRPRARPEARARRHPRGRVLRPGAAAHLGRRSRACA